MSLLRGHAGIQSILSRNSESTLDLKSTAYQSLSNLESRKEANLELKDDLAAQFEKRSVLVQEYALPPNKK